VYDQDVDPTALSDRVLVLQLLRQLLKHLSCLLGLVVAALQFVCDLFDVHPDAGHRREDRLQLRDEGPALEALPEPRHQA